MDTIFIGLVIGTVIGSCFTVSFINMKKIIKMDVKRKINER